MDTIREHTGELVVVRCWCGIQHAIPDSLRRVQLEARDEGGQHAVFCPLGHEYIATGESRLDRARQQLRDERERHERTRRDRDHAEARRRAEKAAKTRLKNRVAKGVCPCCKRSFANVARHMASQHPGFVEGDSDA